MWCFSYSSSPVKCDEIVELYTDEERSELDEDSPLSLTSWRDAGSWSFFFFAEDYLEENLSDFLWP